jgi:hypothetical protein
MLIFFAIDFSSCNEILTPSLHARGQLIRVRHLAARDLLDQFRGKEQLALQGSHSLRLHVDPLGRFIRI